MYVKCPLNYIGGKYKILSNIFEVFPDRIDTFVDLFAGGFNVGINVKANRIICNDHINYIIDLYKFLKDTPVEILINMINERIVEFNLSRFNREGYNLLRDRYNNTKNIVDFFVLTCYSFNHQIRFNNQRNFNTPFGKERSYYNSNIEKNLINFSNMLKIKEIEFINKDFLDIDLSNLEIFDLVYCDPPYLISNGSYNDGNRGFKNWTKNEEYNLLKLLDKLNEQNIRFVLSNVLYHKGLSNDLLIEWSRKYNIYYIDKTYYNCNYQLKSKNTKTVEVLITNY
ncbi:Dam family site-specific DNA-(adenine-N6)-methyltransferase [Megamonas funiformis]|uniref:Dam family site-specific DNA-(adenine-N6)-methyltransferase n=1 Tax=Megamonas funiformis TaxID=437897 RepID=UPI00195A35D4|nr:Dam family site-specific DNA-(adenine-N6)-methyltransferase [Megamonas funiformis]MBM6725695.1 Dam family site-specific DNA-(adenine-N6)-methyltransferase [Megamonas funiformis]